MKTKYAGRGRPILSLRQRAKRLREQGLNPNIVPVMVLMPIELVAKLDNTRGEESRSGFVVTHMEKKLNKAV